MIVRSRSGSAERSILTGMIVSPEVLAKIEPKWKDGLFRSEWANLVGEWCINYFRNYDKAPGPHIEKLYKRWADDTKDEKSAEAIERLLAQLSGEYKQRRKELNPQYVVDEAALHFRRVQIEQLQQGLEICLDNNDVSQAETLAKEYTQIELGSGGTVFIDDDEAIRAALTKSEYDVIVPHRGSLQTFFGDTLHRGGFVSFMAPEKRGKSFWLLDCAIRAFSKHKRVAYFDAGDNTQEELTQRIMSRLSGKPLRGRTIAVPTGIRVDPENGSARVTTQSRAVEKGLTIEEAQQAVATRLKRHKLRGADFRTNVFPNDTLTVSGIAQQLKSWAREDWVADLVVIDYADILASPNPRFDIREATNANWQQLRSISQQFHCLVLTATQADAASYDANTIGRKNFSNDKRKLAHVTGLIGINATPREQEINVQRLNWIVRRSDAASDSRQVYTAGCPDICNPAIHSAMFTKNDTPPTDSAN